MITSSIKLQPRSASVSPQKQPRNRSLKSGLPPRQTIRPAAQKKVSVAPAKKKTAPVKQLSIKEIAEKELASPLDKDRSGEVKLRFNHYNKSFKCFNGVVKWADVEEEYSFNFIYKGAYYRDMFHVPEPDQFGRSDGVHGKIDETRPMRKDVSGMYFIEIKPGEEYKLRVEEHEEDGLQETGLRVHTDALYAADAKTGEEKCRAGNQQVKEITEELMKMDVSDLHGEEAKRLREQRDIEDVLFS